MTRGKPAMPTRAIKNAQARQSRIELIQTIGAIIKDIGFFPDDLDVKVFIGKTSEVRRARSRQKRRRSSLNLTVTPTWLQDVHHNGLTRLSINDNDLLVLSAIKHELPGDFQAFYIDFVSMSNYGGVFYDCGYAVHVEGKWYFHKSAAENALEQAAKEVLLKLGGSA